MNGGDQLEDLVCTVLKSPKYESVCADLVRSIGRRELSKRRNLKKAVKATKNKLHQISGAYFPVRPDYPAWLEKLQKARKAADEDLFRRTCLEIMGYHYSTRERLKVLDRFYAGIFSLLPPIYSVLDLGCGLHPLSIPWMPLEERTEYYAYDIYEDLAEFLNGYLTVVNVEGSAQARDILQNPPRIKVDLAFLLSAIPCLEQIEKSAGLKVLERTNADFLAVSFPVKSLGGREKGMREYYEARFGRLIGEKDWTFQRLEFESELVFLVRKK